MVKDEKVQSDSVRSEQAVSRRKELISVVSAFYNESDVVDHFFRDLKTVLDGLEGITYELIFVDDGSQDDTLARLNRLAQSDSTVRVYSLARNFGHQIALTAGLDAARGSAVIIMDSDLQHPCELVPRMIEKWREGFDIVSGLRQDTEDSSWFKHLSSKIFYRVINYLSETDIPEGAGDFALLSRRSCEALARMPERHRFLRGMISWVGLSRVFIPYRAPRRVAGRSKYSFFKMVSLAVEAALSFSTMPLRLATRAGFVIAFLGFVYFAWIILRYLFVGDLVSGWGSLICVTLIIGGGQLFFIGLVGQYLARVFEEVKGRPMYVLKQSPLERVASEGAAEAETLS